MAYKSPEEELEKFLSAQPSWLRKILQYDFPLTHDEILACNQSDSWWKDGGAEVQEKYETILQRIPAKWREHRERHKQFVLAGCLAGRPGRPRKDPLAEEAQQLRSSGKSYAQVTKQLNLRHGEGTTTSEAIRKLLISRKRGHTPDKT